MKRKSLRRVMAIESSILSLCLELDSLWDDLVREYELSSDRYKESNQGVAVSFFIDALENFKSDVYSACNSFEGDFNV